MSIVEVQTPSAATRYSASWAVWRFAKQTGTEISEALLFGLGRSAWCGIVNAADRGVLLTSHPDSLSRMMMALNAPAERFQYRAQRSLNAADFNVGVCIELDPLRLQTHGQESLDQALPRQYHAWISAVIASDECLWPEVEIEIPDATASQCFNARELADAWQSQTATGHAFTYNLLYAHKVLWNPIAAVRLAISLWIHQMLRQSSPLGPSGLDAIDEYAAMLDVDDLADLEMTRRYAALHGGLSGHRDALAAFFAESSLLLGCNMLITAAELSRTSADLWHRILSAPDCNRKQAAHLLRSIARIERDLLNRLSAEFTQ